MRSRLREAIALPVAFAAGALVFSLPWLLRNLAWSGNPVFPLATGLLGDGGWPDELIARWNQAHALAPGQSRLVRAWEDVVLNPRFAYVLVPATLAAAARALARRDRRGLLLTLWLAIMFAVWFGFTHLQGRFLVVATPAAVLLVASAIRTRRLGVGAVVVTAVAALVGLGMSVRIAWPIVSPSRSGATPLFGAGSLLFATPFTTPEQFAGRDVYLVGEARAFLYPTDRLRYKVVFNVPRAGGALEAWLGDALREAPDGALVVIDPPEVARLARTYGTPPLEVTTGPHPFAWTMGEVRQALRRRGDR